MTIQTVTASFEYKNTVADTVKNFGNVKANDILCPRMMAVGVLVLTLTELLLALDSDILARADAHTIRKNIFLQNTFGNY